MFKCTATDLDTQLTVMQQRLMCAWCACQLFLIPLVRHLESHLFWRTNSEPHMCVYCSNQHQHGALHLGWAFWHSLGIWCTIWQQQGSTEDLSWVFAEESVSRLSYVCFCWLSPAGNWYICSGQAQHRARTVTSHAAMWWHFTVFWDKSPHKHQRGWSHSRHGLSSCVEHCTWTRSPFIQSTEGAGSTRPQRLPLSRPICLLVCAPEYREAWLSRNGVVHGWGLLHPRGDFQWPQQPRLGKSKPANPEAASVHCHQQCLVVSVWVGIVNDFLIGPYLLLWWLIAHIYHVFLEENLPEILEEISLLVRRNMWFQHDRSAAHFARQVREHLTATCNDHWIRQSGPMAWPPR